ncbi:unnamed protein product [Diatraea saccharalis]|uniref:Peptidase S1 domain-containing protein n=1 Tax=Diatraea saccharalis TaxID=40085 RepID=A0A9N9R2T6_9NEOP|nr:unnamed protein product [Diatraea saccharalis]
MKLVIALVLISFANSAYGKAVNPNVGMYDYHRRIGMFEADRIRKFEKDVTDSKSARVVGGSTTTIGLVPYQAGLIITFRVVFTSVCGGSIISDSKILTGAHCYNDGVSIAQSITVVVGSNLMFVGGTRMTASRVVMYPGYNPSIFANDIAVVFVPRLSFSLFIQPINLPFGSELNMNFVGQTALASGFGVTNDGEQVSLTQPITSVNLQVISNIDCQRIYGNLIQGSHLCTNGVNGQGICRGDTGGPLVTTINTRRILIGIGSFTSTTGCQAGHPSGFSRVTFFVPWINSV